MSEINHVHCDCGSVEVSATGKPKVHAFCHCEDCRDLLQVPFHSILAWEASEVEITKGQSDVEVFQHPTKTMTRVFCKNCGEIMYNTNKMGWKLISQTLFRKCNDDKLPEGFESNAHFFYDRRVINIEDELVKR